MPTPKQMEKLAAEAARRSGPSGTGPDAPLPAEYWESVLKDPRACATGAQLRQRRLSEIQRHVLRVSCRRCERTVEIQTADAVRLYGGDAVWKDVASSPSNRSLTDVQSLLDHDKPGRHHRAVSRREPVRWQPGADAGVFPDYKAPIVRNGAEGRELATARWGMPSSQHAQMEATKKRAAKLEAKGKPVDFKELLRMEPDGGTTNIRNVKSKHWTRWLGTENRCVVPFNSFSEFNKTDGDDIWFALDETRPLACFAGIWTNWTSVRKVKEGETTNDLYAFLTTEPNAEVGAIRPKAMPVILTTPDEVETWMTAPPDEALKLQRPLPDGALGIVARGVKEDPAEIA